MRKDKESGAIVVEATISLTAFIFVIFTILSIVNICYIQAKMSIALNSAAKEISQYSYLYYVMGADELDAKLSEGTEEESQLAKNTIDGVGTMLNSLSDAKESIETKDFEKLFEQVNSDEFTDSIKSVDSLVTEYADKLADDPKGFIIGMGKMAGSELKEAGKALLGQVLAKTFMKKNLMAFKGDDPDEFLRRYRVVDGMKGLNFTYTSLMAHGTTNQIQLVVTYDVSVIKLLNIDFKFKFRQAAKTAAWGRGISLITPEKNEESLQSQYWDPDPLVRGAKIVLEEKKKYPYTDSGHGFDAYDNTGGKNEFITIMSIDTDAATNQTAAGVSNAIRKNCNKMKNGLMKLDETINVMDKEGKTVEIYSPKETRTYKVILVVPDDANLDIVKQGISKFNELHPEVTVVINQEHGRKAPSKDEDTQEEQKEE